MPKDLLEKQVLGFKHALTSRLLLNKGTKPKPAMMLKKELQDLWGISPNWKLIPLGKGYYTFVFQNDTDKALAKSKYVWEVINGHLRVREWSRNFDPFKEHSSLANVWVRIHYLPIEYWHEEVIAGVARYVDHPIRIDGASTTRDFGQFARVLVELNMAKPLPNTLLFDADDHAFHIEFSYEQLPHYCPRCKIMGHSPDKCQKIKPTQVKERRMEVAATSKQKQWQEIPENAQDKGDSEQPEGTSDPQPLEQQNATRQENIQNIQNERRLSGSELLEIITKPVHTPVYDNPLREYVSESSEEDETIIADERSHISCEKPEVIAMENAMKAQRLEQILAIAQAPISTEVKATKRGHGRPPKQDT
ncbi:uncharacterized protein LOC130990652 [Salvia miltiorrhiza]|uniref:uncharacterized protein LOC130990652 n=1 Tax=Salvia miltiorrhiza TaxID=226208 RepID=UPI0025AD0DD8|nr:uncharacterized protein LOC130990652 [Salvia miltiorrhiza]